MRTTRHPLYFHPDIRPPRLSTGPGDPGAAAVCTGQETLTPAGQQVEIIATAGQRLLLCGPAGYVWADKSDLVPTPGT